MTMLQLETSNPVVLASGGPLMRVVCVEGDNALCGWRGEDGRQERFLFPIPCLRSLIPYRPCA